MVSAIRRDGSPSWLMPCDEPADSLSWLVPLVELSGSSRWLVPLTELAIFSLPLVGRQISGLNILRRPLASARSKFSQILYGFAEVLPGPPSFFRSSQILRGPLSGLNI